MKESHIFDKRCSILSGFWRGSLVRIGLTQMLCASMSLVIKQMLLGQVELAGGADERTACPSHPAV